MFIGEVSDARSVRWLAAKARTHMKKAIVGSRTVHRFYTRLLGCAHDVKIVQEQRAYERRARACGLTEQTDNELRAALRERLGGRGIVSERACSRPLNLLYASHFGNWETQVPKALEKLGRVTCYSLTERGFDFDAADWVNCRHLLDEDLFRFVHDLHEREPIDIVLSYLNGLQISSETIRAIGSLGIATATFNLDDRLLYRGRFLGGRWTGSAAHAAAYDVNLTNSSASILKYRVDGGLAAFWPAGADPELFRPAAGAFERDVAFVGGRYGARESWIEFLRKSGIKVEAFGAGWERGYVKTQEEMNHIWCTSRINLGFSLVCASQAQTCLKGRDFEIPMCGALYLTTEQPDLHRVYQVGSEVVSYRSRRDCVEKIRFLLSHPEVCDEIRSRARQRCLRDHTWQVRFQRLAWLLGMRPSVEDSST